MTRLAPVQPELIIIGAGTSPSSQIIDPSHLTLFNLPLGVLGQLRLIPMIVIAVELPLVTIHHASLPMSLNPVMVIKEQASVVGLGVWVGVGVVVFVGVLVAVGVYVGV
jgi:hypothetical protein